MNEFTQEIQPCGCSCFLPCLPHFRAKIRDGWIGEHPRRVEAQRRVDVARQALRETHSLCSVPRFESAKQNLLTRLGPAMAARREWDAALAHHDVVVGELGAEYDAAVKEL